MPAFICSGVVLAMLFRQKSLLTCTRGNNVSKIAIVRNAPPELRRLWHA
jgi:hypothetical protein